MKTLLLILSALLLLAFRAYGQQFTNPDGDVVSLTVMQDFQFANYKQNLYDSPAIISWSFLFKYPTSEKSTLMLYYSHSNSQIFSYDVYKPNIFNTNVIGLGATIYFK